MAISREEINDIAKKAASEILEAQGTCVATGMTLGREQASYKKATPIIFRANLRGLVSADDLKIPHSELAMHVGAAGKDLIALTLTGTQTGMATYDSGEGKCGFVFGLETELFKPPLVEKINEMWEKRGPGPRTILKPLTSSKAKPTRDNVRIEVWEERDRLHIGIQDKDTGEYYASWWDDEARQMFEDGFFKPGRELEESVLEYAEDMGILAK